MTRIRPACFLLAAWLGLAAGAQLPASGQGLLKQLPGAGDVATWQVEVIPETARPGQRVAVVFSVDLMDGWKMYSMQSPAGKPLSFTFEELAALTPDGPVVEANVETGYDPNFDSEVTFFHGESTGEAFFRVRSSAAAGATPIEGTINYMVCSDRVCLPPTDYTFATTLQVRR